MPTYIARCTPSLGKVSLVWASMAESLHYPAGYGRLLLIEIDKVGGEIAECRNKIVAEALAFNRDRGPISHLFWLDDDVLVMPNAIMELLSQQVDICSGTYFFKVEGPASQPLLWPGTISSEMNLREFDAPAMFPFRPDVILPVQYCGMGLTLVKLSVYQRMLDELDLGEDRYGNPQWYRTGKDEGFSQRGSESGPSVYTEDSYFLTQTAKLGIQPLGVTTRHAFGFHVQSNWECDCGLSTTDTMKAQAHRRSFPKHKVFEGITGYPQEQWQTWANDAGIRWRVPGGGVVNWEV